MAFEEIAAPVRGGKRQTLSVIDPQVAVAIRGNGKPREDGQRPWQLVLFLNGPLLDRLELEPKDELKLSIGTGPDRGKVRIAAAPTGQGWRIHTMKARKDARVTVSVTGVAALRKQPLGTVRRDVRIVPLVAGGKAGEFDLPSEALAPIDTSRSLMG